MADAKFHPVSAQLLDSDALEITWNDGRVDTIPFDLLRGRCPCAVCVDEWTGERRVHPKDFPDARLDGVSPVGNYAWRLTFADGHDTGFFTWPRLRTVGAEATYDLT